MLSVITPKLWTVSAPISTGSGRCSNYWLAVWSSPTAPSRSAMSCRLLRTVNANRFGDCVLTIEAAIGRYKQVIGDGLRFRKDKRRGTEVAVAVRALNCKLDLGRPISVRIK